MHDCRKLICALQPDGVPNSINCPGFLRLHAQHGTGSYIAIRQNDVIAAGPGGPACELALVPVGPGVFSIAHAHGHGPLAFNIDGNPAFGTGPGDPRGHFRYQIC